MPKRSDDPIYDRKPLSNYEGWKRIDKSVEKLEGRDRAREKICDVCHRRTRAWRMVPATFGTAEPIATANGYRNPFRGRKMALCCDVGLDACSRVLERSGVARQATELHDRVTALGLVLPS